jgi:cyclophilin family peptidyl-prolyl cis-trans isomerase
MHAFFTGAVIMALVAGTSGQTAGGNPVVVIETTMGDITVELDKAKAPVSVENFLSYVKDGYYPGTTFHRVIKGFMIQGGGLTADMQRKPGTKAPIQNEANNGLKNTRGTIAMARTGEVRSATSQFFINTADNAALDHKGMAPPDYGYAVFGKVIAGMDVVDKIEGVATASKGGHQNVPSEPVTIKSVRVKQ